MIFLCGHHNTGKTTLAKWLFDFGFPYIETGDIVRNLYKITLPNYEFSEWATKIGLKYPNYFNECILKEIIRLEKTLPQSKNIIVVGNRQKSGITFLINNHKTSYRNLIIYLVASEDKLYQRQLQRQDRIMKNSTLELFKNEYLAFDKEMGIESIKDIANYIIDSNINIEQVKEKISFILKQNGYII
ncbi:MAG: hypothetical protein DDT21_02714 [Syntrophomonadaceae bacterium]|nr:hypothetical protein [Bacillota bacterium]